MVRLPCELRQPLPAQDVRERRYGRARRQRQRRYRRLRAGRHLPDALVRARSHQPSAHLQRYACPEAAQARRGHQARRRRVRRDLVGRGDSDDRRHHEGDQGRVRQRCLLHPVRHGPARRIGRQIMASRLDGVRSPHEPVGRLPASLLRLFDRSDQLGASAVQRRCVLQQRSDRPRELQEHHPVRQQPRQHPHERFGHAVPHHPGAPAESRGQDRGRRPASVRYRRRRCQPVGSHPSRHRHGARCGHDPLSAYERQARRSVHPRQVRRLLQRYVHRRREASRAEGYHLHGLR